MINKKTIILLLVFQICLIKVSSGLPTSLENIVGGIKKTPSSLALLISPHIINKLLGEKSKYEEMNKYFKELLNVNEQDTVKEIEGKEEEKSTGAYFSCSEKTENTEKKNWNNLKQHIKQGKELTIYNKMKYVESCFTSFSLDYFNINMLQLNLKDDISFWEKLKIIASKTLTDYIFLPFPIILITLSIMDKKGRKTVALSFIIPLIVGIIKIAAYNLPNKIYQKRKFDIKKEDNDQYFELLSSRWKNPSTTSLLTIASVIFLLCCSKKSAAQ